MRTIAVQIGAENSSLDQYHYRIQGTADISLEELQRILMCSCLSWYEDDDYRIEEGIIKVSSKVTG